MTACAKACVLALADLATHHTTAWTKTALNLRLRAEIQNLCYHFDSDNTKNRRKENSQMPDVLVRDVETDVVESLKSRAAVNGRSLQAELKTILEQAAQVTMADAREVAAKIRRSLSGKTHSNSADLLAEDRQR
jgi:plasmid stability protein